MQLITFYNVKNTVPLRVVQRDLCFFKLKCLDQNSSRSMICFAHVFFLLHPIYVCLKSVPKLEICIDSLSFNLSLVCDDSV